MSPRLLRFLLVYVLVGLTFTALASGATERVLRAHFDGAKVACLGAIIQALNELAASARFARKSSRC
jgi:pheromone shutdown protein TraB